MEERSKWEEIIRSKLKDYEVDTLPDDWMAIESRLSGKKVTFSRRWYYAAAIIAVFLLISGGYFYFNRPVEKVLMAEIEKIGGIGETEETGETGEAVTSYELRSDERNNERNNERDDERSGSRGRLQAIPGGDEFFVRNEKNTSYGTENVEDTRGTENNFPILPSYTLPVLHATLLPSPKIKLEVNRNDLMPETNISFNQQFRENPDTKQMPDFQLLADAAFSKTNKKSGRRWTFGAGGGSYSVGMNGGGFANLGRNDGVFAMEALNNDEWYMETPVRRNDNFNSFLANASQPVSKLNANNMTNSDPIHKQPISFGLGIGYTLSNRWSLQSGLVYTLLSSEWRDASLDYQDKFRQQLHFVGIPLGLSYKIAQWNKLRFYATTGVMAEWNVSGNIKTKFYFYEDHAFRTVKEPVRMKELQWSVNARIGATYPVFKFVNAYIEGGANYYFDNHSSIETIRSDKPFHVSLQAGLRFGF